MNTLKFLPIILLVVFGFINLNHTYVLFRPKKTTSPPHLNNFVINQSAKLSDSKIIYFGRKTASPKGIGLILYDSKLKQIIYEDIRVGEEDYIKAHFYKSSLASDGIVILSSTGAEVTHGISIYLFANNNLINCGQMNVVLNENPYKSILDAGPYALIVKSDSAITFSFYKSVTSNYHGLNHKNHELGKLSYVYKNDSLTIKTNECFCCSH